MQLQIIIKLIHIDLRLYKLLIVVNVVHLLPQANISTFKLPKYFFLLFQFLLLLKSSQTLTTLYRERLNFRPSRYGGERDPLVEPAFCYARS